ncbi:MAG TPA: SPOR domain-containing protein [Sphingomonas sp.]|nr:SPOR domain-containing protein [Sphingomonas sp.]
MRWNNKALALLLITGSTAAMAQSTPPLPEGVQATGPAGTSGATGSYDDVGYARVGIGTLVSVEAPGLAAGAFAEVTAIDSGKTILVESAGGSGPDIILSPAAAGQLGVTGDRIAVRVRQVDAPAVDAAALHAGRSASARMDAPPVLLTGLRTMLAAKAAASAPTVATTPAAASSVAKAPASKPAATKPAPPPAAKTPAPKPAATGRYQVQVATFSTRDRAAGVAKAMGGTVQAAGRYFRVRLGPFATRAAATSARDGAAKRGYGDARVVTRD